MSDIKDCINELLFPVLFSTGTEDCGYIIAITSVGIWYYISAKSTWKGWLVLTAAIFSCNLPLVLFRKYATQHPLLLTMLSLPFFIVWLFVVKNRIDSCFGISFFEKAASILTHIPQL